MNPLGPYVRMLESEEAQALFGIPVIGPVLGLLALVPVGIVFLLVFGLVMVLLSGAGIFLHVART